MGARGWGEGNVVVMKPNFTLCSFIHEGLSIRPEIFKFSNWSQRFPLIKIDQ